jgi:hypothetical protein
MLARQQRYELRTEMLPENRSRYLTEETYQKLEPEYLDSIEALRDPTAPSVARGEPTMAPARPAVALDAEQWNRRLAPVRRPDDDIEVPDGFTWEPATLNASAAHSVDEPAMAERAMVSRRGRRGRRPRADHGAATTRCMIDNANVTLELLHEHPLGRARIQY